MKKIRITLIRGLAGKREGQRRTIKALGLKRIHSSVIKEDNPQIRGIIAKIFYMVKVDNVKPVESAQRK